MAASALVIGGGRGIGDAVVDARLEELLDGEAAIAAALPMRAAMH